MRRTTWPTCKGIICINWPRFGYLLCNFPSSAIIIKRVIRHSGAPPWVKAIQHSAHACAKSRDLWIEVKQLHISFQPHLAYLLYHFFVILITIIQESFTGETLPVIYIFSLYLTHLHRSPREQICTEFSRYGYRSRRHIHLCQMFGNSTERGCGPIKLCIFPFISSVAVIIIIFVW